jgi:hypothetical protein
MYAGQREHIWESTGLADLMRVFQRNLGGIYEPHSLIHEARRVAEANKEPPFSEEDV